MSTVLAAGNGSQDAVRKVVIEVLEDMTSDWDLEFDGKIGEVTRLVGDLAFESIDVVHLIVMLGEVYQEKDIAFEKLLMEDGRYVTDLAVGPLVKFLHDTLRERGKI